MYELNRNSKYLNIHILECLFMCSQTRVVTSCYEVLAAFLDGDSRKNELYCARHVSFFESQIAAEVSTKIFYRLFTCYKRLGVVILSCMN